MWFHHIIITIYTISVYILLYLRTSHQMKPVIWYIMSQGGWLIHTDVINLSSVINSQNPHVCFAVTYVIDKWAVLVFISDSIQFLFSFFFACPSFVFPSFILIVKQSFMLIVYSIMHFICRSLYISFQLQVRSNDSNDSHSNCYCYLLIHTVNVLIQVINLLVWKIDLN